MCFIKMDCIKAGISESKAKVMYNSLLRLMFKQINNAVSTRSIPYG